MKTGGKIKPCKVGDVELHNSREKEYVERMKHSRHPLNFYLSLAHRKNQHWVNSYRKEYQGENGRPLKVAKIFDRMIEVYRQHDARGRRPPLKERERFDKKTGKMKKISGWSPIREMIVVTKPDTQLRDFVKVKDWFAKKGVGTMFVSLHFDEGHLDAAGNLITNNHAHVGLDFFNWETGKTVKLNEKDMSELQTVLADALGMERGELKEETGAEHLGIVEFRVQQKYRQIAELDQKLADKGKELLEKDTVIKRAETRVKGLTTMIDNLEKRKDQVEEQIANLEHDLENGEISVADMMQQKDVLDDELKRIISDIGEKAQKLVKANEDLREVRHEKAQTERENRELLQQKEGLRAEIKQLQGEKDETLKSTDAASRENEKLRRENGVFRTAKIGRQNVGDYIKPIDEIQFTAGDVRRELQSSMARHPRIANNTPITVNELEDIAEELVKKAFEQRSVFSPKKTDEEVLAILREKRTILLKVVGKQQKDGIMMAAQKLYRDVRQQISAVTYKNVALNQFLDAVPVDSIRIVADSCVRQLKQQGHDLVEMAKTRVGTVANELGMGLAEAASRAASIAACLILGYENGATAISESCGGGGGSTSGWSGRDKDEKDWQFFGRCLTTAIGMMMPRRKLQGRSNGIRR